MYYVHMCVYVWCAINVKIINLSMLLFALLFLCIIESIYVKFLGAPHGLYFLFVKCVL